MSSTKATKLSKKDYLRDQGARLARSACARTRANISPDRRSGASGDRRVDTPRSRRSRSPETVVRDAETDSCATRARRTARSCAPSMTAVRARRWRDRAGTFQNSLREAESERALALRRGGVADLRPARAREQRLPRGRGAPRWSLRVVVLRLRRCAEGRSGSTDSAHRGPAAAPARASGFCSYQRYNQCSW